MTKIIGHRGAAGPELENSMKAIEAAMKLPVYAIEVDVRRTQDGQLVLMHDPHTGRVGSKRLWLERAPLAKVRELKLKNGQRIPTLEEVFKKTRGKKTLMLDVKSPGIQDELARLFKKYPDVKAFLSGRQYGTLKKFHEAHPDVPFLVQHHYDPMEIIHRARRMGARGICLNMWLMNPLTYRLAQREGLEIYVYTINSRWLVRFFKKFYPESIIITNHPEKLT